MYLKYNYFKVFLVSVFEETPVSLFFTDHKTKRVGTMEKVINDLNRFERLNAQVMAADSSTR